MHANEDVFYIRKAQRWLSPYFYLIESDWRFLRKRPWIPVVDKAHRRISEFWFFFLFQFSFLILDEILFFFLSFFAALATALIKSVLLKTHARIHAHTLRSQRYELEKVHWPPAAAFSTRGRAAAAGPEVVHGVPPGGGEEALW